MRVRVPEPVALLALLGLLITAIVGCRGAKTQTEPRGIGFRLEGDPHVVGGAIVAQPGGREESFLHFVTAGAPGWVSHCMQEEGPSPLVFTFGTNGQGRVRPSPLPADVSARARCVANAAVAEGTGPLIAQTEVTVQLMLKPLP